MIMIEVNGRPAPAEKGEMLLTRHSSGRRSCADVVSCRRFVGHGRLPYVRRRGRRSAWLGAELRLSRRRRHEGPHAFAPAAIKARKTIVELLLAKSSRRLPLLCQERQLPTPAVAEELGVRQRRFAGDRIRHTLDSSSPSIVRDPAKCILCGKCVRVCEEIQHVAAIDFIGRGSRAKVGTAFDEGLNVSSCVNCGQCITVCPTGALTEQSYVKEVFNALNDPEKIVVVQHAPAVSVTLGEEFNLPPGADVAGTMTAALRRLGFDRVFDTGFSAT